MSAQRQAVSERARPQVSSVARVRDGAGGVTEVQRARMLNSALQVVTEEGYGQMSVARVTGRAGVSRRTFYELFEDREACFLAAFDQAIAEMSAIATPAWEAETLWREQIRAALGAVLAFLDEQPGIGSLVVVEALGAGPRVLAHRARLMASLAELIDQGRAQLANRPQPAPLTAEGLVGAVLSVIHARLLTQTEPSLTPLLNPLMGMIVTPYLGGAAATRELERATVHRPTARRSKPPRIDPLEGLPMRVTHRTLRVLTVIADSPGASNRRIADEGGVADQGQISKLLARLESLGLVHNTVAGQPSGEPNQWRLTPRGEEVQQAIRAQSRFSRPGERKSRESH